MNDVLPLYTLQLLQLIFKHLKHEGTAFIASKRFYFGLGGGSSELIRLLCESPYSGAFQGEVVWSVDDGKSNIREIVEVRHAAA